MEETMGIYLVAGVIGGLIAGTIASSRGLSFGPYFVLGAFVPILGIILAAVAQAPGNKLAQLTPAKGQGWWPDPTGRFEHRWFDGRHWTRHVGRQGSQFEDPL